MSTTIGKLLGPLWLRLTISREVSGGQPWSIEGILEWGLETVASNRANICRYWIRTVNRTVNWANFLCFPAFGGASRHSRRPRCEKQLMTVPSMVYFHPNPTFPLLVAWILKVFAVDLFLTSLLNVPLLEAQKTVNRAIDYLFLTSLLDAFMRHRLIRGTAAHRDLRIVTAIH